MLAALGTALSDDGKLDAREAQACLPEVREAQAALAQLTHDLERVADSPPMVPRRAPRLNRPSCFRPPLFLAARALRTRLHSMEPDHDRHRF